MFYSRVHRKGLLLAYHCYLHKATTARKDTERITKGASNVLQRHLNILVLGVVVV